jgi:hypothetical protein
MFSLCGLFFKITALNGQERDIGDGHRLGFRASLSYQVGCFSVLPLERDSCALATIFEYGPVATWTSIGYRFYSVSVSVLNFFLPVKRIEEEYSLSPTMILDWGQFYRDPS